MTDERPIPPPSACTRCGGQLESEGVHRVRTGGTSGGWKLLFDGKTELGEGMIDLEMLVCARCRHVELRLPDR